MKKMSFAAKVAGLCVFILLFVVIKLISNMDFIRSETVVLDEKEGYIVFYTSGEQLYQLNNIISIETEQQIYENVVVTGIFPIDLYIGTNQALMYSTDLPASGYAGTTAVIHQPCGSLLDYMVSRNKSEMS